MEIERLLHSGWGSPAGRILEHLEREFELRGRKNRFSTVEMRRLGKRRMPSPQRKAMFPRKTIPNSSSLFLHLYEQNVKVFAASSVLKYVHKGGLFFFASEEVSF